MAPTRRDLLKKAGTLGVAGITGIAATDTAAAHGYIPSHYLDQYQATGRNWGLDWTYLAGIGWVETQHGQYTDGCATSSAGARGPMQFMPSTWDAYGLDGNNDGSADICDYRDAIPSAAYYLTDHGAPGDWDSALYAYNPSWDYVSDVKSWRNHYVDHYGSGNDDPGYSWPTYSYGDQEEAVYSIQYLLEEHGYALQYHDGIYGSEVESTVTQFQQDNGLSVDGVVGPETWNALYVTVWDASNDPWWATYGAQHHLRYGQGYSIAVDGYYGPETESAVESFQSNAGIAVDGVIGHDTWQALMAL